MKALRISALVTAAFALSYCAGLEGTGSPGLDIQMSGAFRAQMDRIQVAVVKNSAIDSAALTALSTTCLKDVMDNVQGGNSNFVRQRDSSGTLRTAVSFPADAGEIEVGGIAPGSGYLFVVEVISRNSQLLGTGKVLVDKFEAKEDQGPFTLNVFGNPDGGVLNPCDPTIATQ